MFSKNRLTVNLFLKFLSLHLKRLNLKNLNFKKPYFKFIFVIHLAFIIPTLAWAQPALWQLKYQDKTSFLFGTIHATTPDMLNSLTSIKTQLRHAKLLVAEVNTELLNQPQINQIMLKQASLADPHTLKSLFSEHEYQMLKHYSATLGIQLNQLQQFKPWFVALQLSIIQAQQAGFSFTHSIDQHLMDYAQQQDITVMGLETVDFQFSLFNNQLDLGKAMLLDSIAQAKIDEFQIAYLANAWQNGQLNKIETLMETSDSFASYQFIENELLIKRNQNWIKQLLPLLAQGDVFIAVGLMHMAGEHSLLKLLEQSQVKINRIQ